MLRRLEEQRNATVSEEQKQWYDEFRQQQIENGRVRPRVEEDEPVPDAYLVRVFYKSFVLSQANHVGVFRKVNKVTYWIGLVNPPVFYMFDEIVVEAFQRYVPVHTTEQRWEDFKRNYNRRIVGVPQKHFSFQCVFTTLKEKKYIQEVCDGESTLDDSVEDAARTYLRETVEIAGDVKKAIRKNQELFDAWTGKIASMITHIHAFEHINQAWVFTPTFWDMVKTMEK
jgi:hypothetical protein